MFESSASVETLRRRAELTAVLRQFFHNADFWEVETPLWSTDTCVDAWIDPVSCSINGVGAGFLQTSPEFHLKRLLACGADRIWSLTRSFRSGEAGTRHNPEFSIVEWYRVGDTHRDAMDLTEQLVRTVATGTSLQLTEQPFPIVSYYDAFERVLGIRVDEMTANDLAAVAIEHAPEAIGPFDRDGWLNVLLAQSVEPWLATFEAVFLTGYPASQAALAKIRDDDVPVAERFELYVGGVELANGYHELTDPAELRQRFNRENAKRAAAGKEQLPVESRLLEAMDHGLPDSSGVALGWDRLVMLCVGEQSIDAVMPFPIDRA